VRTVIVEYIIFHYYFKFYIGRKSFSLINTFPEERWYIFLLETGLHTEEYPYDIFFLPSIPISFEENLQKTFVSESGKNESSEKNALSHTIVNYCMSGLKR